MDRKTFLTTSLMFSAGTLLLPPSLKGRKRLPEETVYLRRNVGLFTGRGGTIGWLADDNAIVVVDSQFPATAQILHEVLEQRSSAEITALINTHHHSDHTSGNPYFRGITEKIIAQENVPGFQRAAAESQSVPDQQVYADTTFREYDTIDTGDEVIHLSHYGPAHTGGDCVVRFEKANIIHLGDLVFNRWFPFIDLDGGASIENWIETLETVASDSEQDTLFIFGHGANEFGVTGQLPDVLLMRDYLHYLLDVVQTGRADGRSLSELLQAPEPSQFPSHVSAGGRLSFQHNLEAAWQELGNDS